MHSRPTPAARVRFSRRAYGGFAVLYMGMIFGFSSFPIPMPGAAVTDGEPNWLGHVLVVLFNVMHVPLFGGFAFLVHRAFAEWRDGTPVVRRGSILPTVAIVIAYSLADEAHQAWTPGRVPSISDIVLNGIGTWLALTFEARGWARSRGVLIVGFALAIGVVEVGGRFIEHERWLVRTIQQRLRPVPEDGVISEFRSFRRWGPFPPKDEEVELEFLAARPEAEIGTESVHGLRVRIPPGRPGGIRSKSMPTDLREFSRASLRLVNEGDSTVRLTLSFREYIDEAVWRADAIEVPPGEHELEFDLRGAASEIDVSRIRAVRFIAAASEEQVRLRFSRLAVGRR